RSRTSSLRWTSTAAATTSGSTSVSLRRILACRAPPGREGRGSARARGLCGSRDDMRRDERQLAQDFGVSRTPVREAMAQLEREGFVRSVPRRGVYIVRKTKKEVIEMITACAALESMGARLITESAGDEQIAALRRMFATFENGRARAHLDEYSEVNIEFHQTIIRMSRNHEIGKHNSEIHTP